MKIDTKNLKQFDIFDGGKYEVRNLILVEQTGVKQTSDEFCAEEDWIAYSQCDDEFVTVKFIVHDEKEERRLHGRDYNFKDYFAVRTNADTFADILRRNGRTPPRIMPNRHEYEQLMVWLENGRKEKKQ